MYTLLGIQALGTWISTKWIKFREHRRQEMMINFGIGLGVFLLLIYVLTLTRALFPGVIRIIFLGLGSMIRYMRKPMNEYTDSLSSLFTHFRREHIRGNWMTWMGVILLAVTIMYYFYGFNLSFIPYSTAWDANHAYMYVPKILAENHGVLR